MFGCKFLIYFLNIYYPNLRVISAHYLLSLLSHYTMDFIYIIFEFLPITLSVYYYL